mgnify:CR=1 FL=1
MVSGNGFLKIKEEDLKELFDFQARTLVGKVCKRIELFGSNSELIKRDSKELIYEAFRDLSSLVYTYGKGVDAVTQFQFKKRETKS